MSPLRRLATRYEGKPMKLVKKKIQVEGANYFRQLKPLPDTVVLHCTPQKGETLEVELSLPNAMYLMALLDQVRRIAGFQMPANLQDLEPKS